MWAIQNCVKTVSYTHLDVYKRQVVGVSSLIAFCVVSWCVKSLFSTNFVEQNTYINDFFCNGSWKFMNCLATKVRVLCLPADLPCLTWIASLQERKLILFWLKFRNSLSFSIRLNTFFFKIYMQKYILMQPNNVYFIKGIGTVSYTHLDVYKRQII